MASESVPGDRLPLQLASFPRAGTPAPRALRRGETGNRPRQRVGIGKVLGKAVGTNDLMSLGRSGPRIASTTGTTLPRRMCTVVEALNDSVKDLRAVRPLYCRRVVPVPK